MMNKKKPIWSTKKNQFIDNIVKKIPKLGDPDKFQDTFLATVYEAETSNGRLNNKYTIILKNYSLIPGVPVTNPEIKLVKGDKVICMYVGRNRQMPVIITKADKGEEGIINENYDPPCWITERLNQRRSFSVKNIRSVKVKPSDPDVGWSGDIVDTGISASANSDYSMYYVKRIISSSGLETGDGTLARYYLGEGKKYERTIYVLRLDSIYMYVLDAAGIATERAHAVIDADYVGWADKPTPNATVSMKDNVIWVVWEDGDTGGTNRVSKINGYDLDDLTLKYTAVLPDIAWADDGITYKMRWGPNVLAENTKGELHDEYMVDHTKVNCPELYKLFSPVCGDGWAGGMIYGEYQDVSDHSYPIPILMSPQGMAVFEILNGNLVFSFRENKRHFQSDYNTFTDPNSTTSGIQDRSWMVENLDSQVHVTPWQIKTLNSTDIIQEIEPTHSSSLLYYKINNGVTDNSNIYIHSFFRNLNISMPILEPSVKDLKISENPKIIFGSSIFHPLAGRISSDYRVFYSNFDFYALATAWLNYKDDYDFGSSNIVYYNPPFPLDYQYDEKIWCYARNGCIYGDATVWDKINLEYINWPISFEFLYNISRSKTNRLDVTDYIECFRRLFFIEPERYYASASGYERYRFSHFDDLFIDSLFLPRLSYSDHYYGIIYNVGDPETIYRTVGNYGSPIDVEICNILGSSAGGSSAGYINSDMSNISCPARSSTCLTYAEDYTKDIDKAFNIQCMIFQELRRKTTQLKIMQNYEQKIDCAILGLTKNPVISDSLLGKDSLYYYKNYWEIINGTNQSAIKYNGKNDEEVGAITSGIIYRPPIFLWLARTVSTWTQFSTPVQNPAKNFFLNPGSLTVSVWLGYSPILGIMTRIENNIIADSKYLYRKSSLSFTPFSSLKNIPGIVGLYYHLNTEMEPGYYSLKNLKEEVKTAIKRYISDTAVGICKLPYSKEISKSGLHDAAGEGYPCNDWDVWDTSMRVTKLNNTTDIKFTQMPESISSYDFVTLDAEVVYEVTKDTMPYLHSTNKTVADDCVIRRSFNIIFASRSKNPLLNANGTQDVNFSTIMKEVIMQEGEANYIKGFSYHPIIYVDSQDQRYIYIFVGSDPSASYSDHAEFEGGEGILIYTMSGELKAYIKNIKPAVVSQVWPSDPGSYRFSCNPMVIDGNVFVWGIDPVDPTLMRLYAIYGEYPANPVESQQGLGLEGSNLSNDESGELVRREIYEVSDIL